MTEHEPLLIAEFPFVVNKSFLGPQRPITIPARFYEGLKEHLVEIAATRTTVAFREESVMEGSIRIGWRAGGRYYQITTPRSQISQGLDKVQMGSTVFVRILKKPHHWLVQIR